MSHENLIFDRNLLLKKQSNKYLSKSDFLIKRSFDDILERLSEITRKFPIILNLGQKNNYIRTELRKNPSTLKIIETDFNAEEMISLKNESCDLIISILNLHKINDLPGCLIQLKKTLKPNGILMASIFGGNNLAELRHTLLKTELEFYAGISPRSMPLIELKQLGSLLQRVGFDMPIIDSDRIEVHYKHPINLLHDLRNMSETNIMIDRNKDYLGRKFWNKFYYNYINDFSTINNEIIANFEIINFIAINN